MSEIDFQDFINIVRNNPIFAMHIVVNTFDTNLKPCNFMQNINVNAIDLWA